MRVQVTSVFSLQHQPRALNLFFFSQSMSTHLTTLFLSPWILARYLIMLPVLLSVITRALVTSDNCFGGVETFEKIAASQFQPNTVPMAGILLQQDNVALTRDCINLCKQQQRCNSFTLDYRQYRCSSYIENSRRHRDHLETSKTSSLFEKVCLKGISRQEFDHLCGNERLWAFERVQDSFIDGFIEKELNNMVDREECAKACITETAFICRSADFDEVKRICRLSKENRRTQPQAFVFVKNSQRDYMENQCAPSGPASCVYMTKSNINVHSMDSLLFATSSEDCQLQCDRETSFNCRSYGFVNNRCMLSGDDERTIGKHPLVPLKGAMYGEKTCVAELCTNGIFTYEKITGHVLRSAITSPVELPDYSSLGVTNWCRESCDMAQLNCPAFTVNYQNNRCERLDRNTQGRTTDLLAKDGESYFEKICLRVPQIMSQCQDKFWAFERVLGYELAPVLYVKTLNFVQSRRDCQEYCLQEREFPCRSALYNDETTECKLSAEDRRTSPGHYYRSRSIKVNYLENQCVRIHSSCPYVRTDDSYPTYTDVVETSSVTSREACEKMCNDNRHFLCRSYAFYSSNSQCFLSGDDSVSAGASFSQKRSSIMYYERQCSKLPINTVNSTLSENPSYLTAAPPASQTYPNDLPKDNLPTSATPDIDNANVNKEVVILNGTLGGIITTRITRFPESLIPTLPPQSKSSEPTLPIGQSSQESMSNGANVGTIIGISHSDSLPSNMNHGNSMPFSLSPNTKCAPNARFLFEKVTSFEPIGGHLTLLYSDLQNPGIVTECARRCEHSALCRAFVVDYYHQSCHGLFENSSVGLLDLRLSMGKDYFEGFCVPNYVHCDKFWPFDRIIDQMVVGSQPEEIVRFVSRSECRTRCLEERKFKCLSASYNSFTHECHLYSEDRNSGALNLQFNKGIDFMENQCIIDIKSCRYHAIERDMSIVSVTKSIRGTSTFHCEQACDYEREFNCRSYTYLDNPDGSLAPGGNLCLLSADNRATSHQGSIQFRPRALYAEKDCAFQRMPPELSVPQHPIPQFVHSQPTQPGLQSPAPSHGQSRRPQSAEHTHQSGDTAHLPLSDPRHVTGVDMPNIANLSHAQYPNQMYDDLSQLQHVPPRCNPREFTFEKTFGFDLRYARRERAPISARPGVITYCKEECLRRNERCLAFIIEYGANQQQNCFFLDEAASENRNQLSQLAGTSYNEKVCLREKTCESIWSFERIIGYTFEEHADKEIKSIMLRTACQDLCLAERSFPCRSLTYDYGRRVCRLFRETRRSKPFSFKVSSDHVDYFENKCAKELSTCQYRDYHDRYFSYIDKIVVASSLADCQRQCDSELHFHCKSVNFDPVSRECSLSSEDSFSLSTLYHTHSSNMQLDQLPGSFQQDSIFSEKGNCEQVSVQCNQQDMMLTLNFDSPFYGRVYTKSNPSQCYVNGNGQTQLQFAIPLNSRCGTHQESTSNYVNEVIVQQHSVIMTDSDRTIRVLCSFEISDQTITLGTVEQSSIPLSPNGIDVSPNLHGRSYNDRKMVATVVTNTAAPPSIVMRILDNTGNDAQVVSLGDDLALRIELRDHKDSAFAMFARNLYARSSSGESLFLIDTNGCPIDSSIFPALQLDPSDNRSLYSKFKAFRFPSTGVVNFEVQIRFCQEYCEPIKCAQSNSFVHSFGRRKRRSVSGEWSEPDKLTARSTVGDEWLPSSVSDPTMSINSTTHKPSGATGLSMAFAEIIKSSSGHFQLSNASTNSEDNSVNYIRTLSNKTGFAYPSDTYRYYRNQNSNVLNSIYFDVGTNVSFGESFGDRSDNEKTTKATLQETSAVDGSKNTLNFFHLNSSILPVSPSLTSDVSSDWSSNNLHPQLSTVVEAESSSNDDQNPVVNEQPKQDDTDQRDNHLRTLSNALLPLPTSATEVPLSLAIMVDDNDEVNDKMDGDIRGNEFDDKAQSYGESHSNLPVANDHRYSGTGNYADMAAARLETRHDLRHRHDKPRLEGQAVCAEQCSNIGVVVFLTTLIVTMVHLVFGTSVYLYLSKLRRGEVAQDRERRFHSLAHYMTPSTTSSISSIGRSNDLFSVTEETPSNLTNCVIMPPAETPPLDQAIESSRMKPHKWFGLPNDQEFGSIRSSFNRENIFFGPKEQRFLGLNNYAFPLNTSRLNIK